MSAALKLISLNIERAKHFDRILPFLKEQKPDVACFQEVREPDVSLLKETMDGSGYVFAPMCHHASEGNPAVVGICIVSRLPLRGHGVDYYRGTPDSLPNALLAPEQEKDDAIVAASMNCALSLVDVEKSSVVYRIATTHFLWSRKGRFSTYQREAMQKLLSLLEAKGEFVFAGDFNAPRGGEIFGMIAAKYKDNIPAHYKTSLDISLHRSGKLHPEQLGNKMVDGLFSTPQCVVSNVELPSGVSDHLAIVAYVSKVP